MSEGLGMGGNTRGRWSTVLGEWVEEPITASAGVTEGGDGLPAPGAKRLARDGTEECRDAHPDPEVQS